VSFWIQSGSVLILLLINIEIKPIFNYYQVNPMIPVPPITACDEPWPFSTSDVTTFDQNWHHLYSTSAGEEDLSNDA